MDDPVKPENASGQVWVWRPVAHLRWDEEKGFSLTLDFDGGFDYLSDECENFDGGIAWGQNALDLYAESTGQFIDSIQLFDGFKPKDPNYRTAEDIQAEFLELLRNNEATGGQ